jgi:hypothetical protein
VPSAEDISFVQKKEDETNKVIMMLDANAEILKGLVDFYLGLMNNDDFTLKNDNKCKRAVDDFRLQLQGYCHDFKLHAARARTLGKITADRKNLVSLKIFRKLKSLTDVEYRFNNTFKRRQTSKWSS